MGEMLHSIDVALFLFFNSTIANPVFDAAFPLITDKHFWIVPGVAAAAWFLKVEKKRAAIAIGLALVTVAISDPLAVRILKPLIDRDRPCDRDALVEGGRFLLGHKGSRSFPSAHATNIFAQAALFSCLYPRATPWCVSFAATIGFSRIYVGVHYPFDVLGGAVVGSAVGGLVFLIFSRIRRRFGTGESTTEVKGAGGDRETTARC